MTMYNKHPLYGDPGKGNHYFFTMERREHPIDPGPRPISPKDDVGPKKPDSTSPEKDELLKRMRKVDPKQAERYRQRTGE